MIKRRSFKGIKNIKDKNEELINTINTINHKKFNSLNNLKSRKKDNGKRKKEVLNNVGVGDIYNELYDIYKRKYNKKNR